MNDPNEKKIYDIHERIFQFVVKVLKFMRKVPKTPENLNSLGQLGRSITSAGANDQEADGASSRRDFINKYAIVRKELKESNFWLRVIGEVNPQLKKAAQELIAEAMELIRIVSTIMHRAETSGVKKKK